MAPNPGSDEAIEQGCTCPVLDNAHGEGMLGLDMFVIAEGCPLHEMPQEEDDDGRDCPS